ncbi:MAG: hypothetical protein P4L11_13640 [Geothrix sp.]|nr:hypothetical protein [Geothrix sp.]
MTPLRWKILAGAIVALVLVYGTFWVVEHHRRATGSKDEAQAQVFKGEANATEAQARQTDAKTEDAKAGDVAAGKVVARVEAERAPLRKAWESRPVPPDILPPAASDDRAALIEQLHQAEALIEKDQEDIEALQKACAAKDVLIASALQRGDEWKATAELREKQALAQEAATAAWKEAVTASRWEGRMEGGGAVGGIWGLAKLLGHL